MTKRIPWEEIYKIDEESFRPNTIDMGLVVMSFGDKQPDHIKAVKRALDKIESTETGQQLFRWLLEQNDDRKITIRNHHKNSYSGGFIKCININIETIALPYITDEPAGQDQLALFELDDVIFHESVHDLQKKAGVVYGGSILSSFNEQEAVKLTNEYKKEIGRPERVRYRDTLRLALYAPDFVTSSPYSLKARIFGELLIDEGATEEEARKLAPKQAQQLNRIVKSIENSKIDFNWIAAIPKGKDIEDLDEVEKIVQKIIKDNNNKRTQR